MAMIVNNQIGDSDVKDCGGFCLCFCGFWATLFQMPGPNLLKDRSSSLAERGAGFGATPTGKLVLLGWCPQLVLSVSSLDEVHTPGIVQAQSRKVGIVLQC
jgi:hypothetical protein